MCAHIWLRLGHVVELYEHTHHFYAEINKSWFLCPPIYTESSRRRNRENREWAFLLTLHHLNLQPLAIWRVQRICNPDGSGLGTSASFSPAKKTGSRGSDFFCSKRWEMSNAKNVLCVKLCASRWHWGKILSCRVNPPHTHSAWFPWRLVSPICVCVQSETRKTWLTVFLLFIHLFYSPKHDSIVPLNSDPVHQCLRGFRSGHRSRRPRRRRAPVRVDRSTFWMGRRGRRRVRSRALRCPHRSGFFIFTFFFVARVCSSQKQIFIFISFFLNFTADAKLGIILPERSALYVLMGFSP